MIIRRLLDALADAFPTKVDQDILLAAASFPAGKASSLPPTAFEFWFLVCQEIVKGSCAGLDLDTLMKLAASLRPMNPHFDQFR
jgi:hypothetical protein